MAHAAPSLTRAGTRRRARSSPRTGTNHMIARRSLLKGIAAAGATLMSQSIRAQSATASGLIRRAIPAGGERLPVIGLGTYQAFDVGNDSRARAALTQVLRSLTAKGGSVVDSSPMYGRAEGVVGDLSAEAGLRPRLFLATKVWTSGKDAGIRQMEDSFRLMRTDGSHADPQSFGLAHAYRNTQRVEGARACALHRHHALSCGRVRRSGAAHQDG